MKIWICIPVFNRIKFTLKCLASIQRQTYKEYCVVVCDHGSSDGTSEAIRTDYPDVIVLHESSELWWTGATNCCVEYALLHGAEDDLLLTINNDTEISNEYLNNLINCSNQYKNSVITSVIRDIETGELDSIGYRQNWLLAKVTSVSFDQDHLEGDDKVIEITHASGRGTLYPLSVYRNIGLYDEKHLPQYGADYDFSHRARRAGYPVYVCADCEVFSYVDATGLTSIRQSFSLQSFKEYLFGMKSPANIKVRWWVGWNNCPKVLFPVYIVIDMARVIGSYFKHFVITDEQT